MNRFQSLCMICILYSELTEWFRIRIRIHSIPTIFITQNDKIENEKSLTKCIRFEQTFSIKFILTSIYITFVHYSLYCTSNEHRLFNAYWTLVELFLYRLMLTNKLYLFALYLGWKVLHCFVYVDILFS